MRWTVHGERSIYRSDWVNLSLVEVEPPGRDRFEHHVVRMPLAAVGTVVLDAGRVLLLHRHRFITDSWGWEVPAGRVESGERPADAAVRETIEETGWRPRQLRPMFVYHPAQGTTDQTFHVFAAAGAERVAAPVDTHESDRIEWLPLSDVRDLITAGQIVDGLSLTALLHALAIGGADDSAREPA